MRYDNELFCVPSQDETRESVLHRHVKSAVLTLSLSLLLSVTHPRCFVCVCVCVCVNLRFVYAGRKLQQARVCIWAICVCRWSDMQLHDWFV